MSEDRLSKIPAKPVQTQNDLSYPEEVIVDGIGASILFPAVSAGGLGMLVEGDRAVEKTFREQGTGPDDKYKYKSAHIAGGLAAVGAGVGTTVAVSGATTAAVGVAGAAAAVAAPVVATVVVAEAANETIETAKMYSRVDKVFHESADLKYLTSIKYRLADSLTARDVKVDEDGRWDMTDEKNRKAFREAIAEKKTELQETMKANDSILPRAMRWGQSLAKYSDAKQDLAIFEAGEKELAQFEKQLRDNYSPGTKSAGEIVGGQVKDTFSVANADHFPKVPLITPSEGSAKKNEPSITRR